MRGLLQRAIATVAVLVACPAVARSADKAAGFRPLAPGVLTVIPAPAVPPVASKSSASSGCATSRAPAW